MKFKATSEEIPNDCQPVITTRVMRFKHYMPSSQQFKKGIKGRWQEHNGYGWHNCEAPESWITLEEFNK